MADHLLPETAISISFDRRIIINCREFRHCSEKTFTSCPAYPNNGLNCCKITGAKRDLLREGSRSVKEPRKKGASTNDDCKSDDF
jgi:hypothetical protein